MAHQLPPQIEIFKPGRCTDDAGTVHNFSAADVAGMVASYDPALREAPLTIGHPAHNLPAYGWVNGLSLNASGAMVMNTHQVQPQFAEMVDKKLFKKRSASFYPPTHSNNPKPGSWYLRHVAFLGAQPPAIAGLADFADDSAGAVSFSEVTDAVAVPAAVSAALTTAAAAAAPVVAPISATPLVTPLPTQEHIRMTQELKDQLAAAQAKNTELAASAAKAVADAAAAQAQLAQFAEAARTQRTAGFVSFADAQIKTGALLPKEKDAAVAVLDTLADAKPVSFAEAGAVRTVSAVDWLKDLITRAKPAVSFGEHAAGVLPGASQGTAGLSEADLDTKAKAYARQHKVNYAEALNAVVSFTS